MTWDEVVKVCTTIRGLYQKPRIRYAKLIRPKPPNVPVQSTDDTTNGSIPVQGGEDKTSSTSGMEATGTSDVPGENALAAESHSDDTKEKSTGVTAGDQAIGPKSITGQNTVEQNATSERTGTERDTGTNRNNSTDHRHTGTDRHRHSSDRHTGSTSGAPSRKRVCRRHDEDISRRRVKGGDIHRRRGERSSKNTYVRS